MALDASKITPKELAEVDPWWWAFHNQIRLQHGLFDPRGHEYQYEVMASPAKRTVDKKASQMTFSESHILKNIHGMIMGRYPKGVFHLFPTDDDVGEFSKARIAPLIRHNPGTIGKYMGETDATNIKKVGRSFYYLHGTRVTQKIGGIKKESSKLRTRSVDRLVFDEYDLMDPAMVQEALERISHSEVQEEAYISSPTIPDWGIDKLWAQSDQRLWMIKCEACGTETCLEMEFPDCIREVSKSHAIRICRGCRAEIFSKSGRWVPSYPDRSQDLVGRWISQLNSRFVDPKKILDLYRDPPNGNLGEVYNSKLGMAYIDAQNRLTLNDVWDILGREPMLEKHPGPCAMGVDRGRDLHITILDRPREGTVRLVKACTRSVFANERDQAKGLSSLDPLHDLIKQYGVKTIVIDNKPEPGKVRDFRAAESEVEVYGCEYLEQGRGVINWDSKAGIVRVNRTEICDSTHDLVITPGKFELPRRSTELEEFAKHLCNIARVMEEDQETGSKEMRYRKLGPDHYRHSLNYAVMAAKRVGIYVEPRKRKKTADAYDEEEKKSGSWMAA